MLTGIAPEIAANLEAKLRYSPEDLAAIYAVRSVVFNGFPLRMNDHDLICTLEGMQRQIDAFTMPAGLIYYAKVIDGAVTVLKEAVVKV